MTDTPANGVGRMLMAVDASTQNYDALEAAAEFASQLRTHLMALFVEDINLLKLAELPFAKELDRSSGIMRPLDPERVTRAFRADARKFEKRLGEESAKRRISVSMRVVRGHHAAAALEMAAKGDIVFLDNVVRLPYGSSRPQRSASKPRKPVSPRQPIWVFYDGSKKAERALTLALGLCRKSGSDLKVVVTVDAAGKKPRSRLAKILSIAPVSGYQLVSLSDREALTATVESSGGSVLIIPRDRGQFAADADLLADKLGCPRILV